MLKILFCIAVGKRSPSYGEQLWANLKNDLNEENNGK